MNVRKRNLSSEQMLFQVSAFSAAKLSLVAAARLWDGFGMFSKEDGNFLVYSLADIDCAMDVIGRFVPIDLPGCDFDVVARVSVSEFDSQGMAAEDDRRPNTFPHTTSRSSIRLLIKGIWRLNGWRRPFRKGPQD